jgi:hypothetical protein
MLSQRLIYKSTAHLSPHTRIALNMQAARHSAFKQFNEFISDKKKSLSTVTVHWSRKATYWQAGACDGLEG